MYFQNNGFISLWYVTAFRFAHAMLLRPFAMGADSIRKLPFQKQGNQLLDLSLLGYLELLEAVTAQVLVQTNLILYTWIILDY